MKGITQLHLKDKKGLATAIGAILFLAIFIMLVMGIQVYTANIQREMVKLQIQRASEKIELEDVSIEVESWWNQSWSKRRPILINNTANFHDLTDYQIFVHVEYDSDMKPDFSDLRFTWYNETTGLEEEIPYWIEKKEDGNYANIWVKIPYIEGNTYYDNTNTTVFMYYDNPDAESKSNGKETFILYEDWEPHPEYQTLLFQDSFETGIINTTEWETGGTVPWYVDNLDAAPDAGEWSARSGKIPQYVQYGVSWIQKNFDGKALIYAWWKRVIVYTYDRLELYVDNKRIYNCPSSSWTRIGVITQPEGSTVKWHFIKWSFYWYRWRGTLDAFGRLDDVKVYQNPNEWESGGNTRWFLDYDESGGFDWSSRSGMIGRYQSTWIKTTVSSDIPMQVKFYWKWEGFSYWDWFRFYVDGVLKDTCTSGSWSLAEHIITSGTHELSWKIYRRNSLANVWGWVDNIIVRKYSLPEPQARVGLEELVGDQGCQISLKITNLGPETIHLVAIWFIHSDDNQHIRYDKDTDPSFDYYIASGQTATVSIQHPCKIGETIIIKLVSERGNIFVFKVTVTKE